MSHSRWLLQWGRLHLQEGSQACRHCVWSSLGQRAQREDCSTNASASLSL